jgi:hypothetical protein
MLEQELMSNTNWRYTLKLRFLNFVNSTSGPLFKHLQKRGILVMFWSPNTEDEIIECFKVYSGVDGIMSCRPSLVTKVIAAEKGKK